MIEEIYYFVTYVSDQFECQFDRKMIINMDIKMYIQNTY